ncbi:MAG: phage tail protein [Blautia sp.]|nr:phage tail protein [Blautia sp.]
MPQPYNNPVITNAGRELIARAQAGEIKVAFTRVAVGNGAYTDDEKAAANLQEMTALKSQKNSYRLSGIDVISRKAVKVTAMITNQDPETSDVLIDQDYYITEMGLYAKPQGGEDSTEILYSITVSSGEYGDYMPAYDGSSPAQIIQEYVIAVSNAAQIVIQTENGSVAMAKDLEDAKDKISEIKSSIIEVLKNYAAKDITDEVVWNTSCTSDRHAMIIGNIVIIKAMYNPATGNAVNIATIPEQYIPQSLCPVHALISSYSDKDKFIVANINSVNGNVVVEIWKLADDPYNTPTNFPIIVEGFWFLQSGEGMATVWENIVDNTLTQAGRAADAKIVGDDITKLQMDVSNICATDNEADAYLFGGDAE